MMVAGERHRTSRAITVGAWLCASGAALGGLGLLGWAMGWEHLYTLVPGQPPMMPNTAVALLATGVVGVMLRHGRPRWRGRIVSLLLSLLVLAIGVGTLAEYTIGADLHIDQLLFNSRLGPHPGRPGPLTAMALSLLGVAILSLDWHPDARQRPCEWLLIAAALTALVGLTGQILGAGEVYRLPRTPVVGMAVPSAVGLLALSIGLLLTRPAAGLMAVATSPGPGGVLLRRIAVPYAVTSMLLGFGITRLFDILDVEEFPLVVASIAVGVTVMGLVILVITARLLERTHEALKRSRARTEEIVALASDGILVTDGEGRFTEVNEAGLQLLGVTCEEIIGRTARDFVLPEEIPRLEALRAELSEGGRDLAEWHLRHKSGEYIPVEVSSRALSRGRWQGFVRDIRERKAAEEEAQRSRQRIEGIISIAADAIISIDESQRITMFNSGAEKTFGWTAREAIGQPLDILIPERFREAHRQHVRAFAQEARTSRMMGERRTVFGQRKDGSEFFAEAAISKLRIGDEITFTVVMRDITVERRRTDQDRLLAAVGLLLTSSLDRMQLVRDAGNLFVGEFADICAIDLIDDPKATPAATRSIVTHRDAAKAELARAFEGLQLERRLPRVEAAVVGAGRTTLVSEVTSSYLEAIAHSDEHLRMLHELAPTSLLSVPLQARGLLLGVLTFASTDPRRRYDEGDATFVEEISRRLALSLDNARLFETTTSAVATRDEVLRVVAHDLRNPLSTILMLASSLHGDEDGKATDKSQQTARSIEVAARRMNRLIRDLLEVTRSETGALSLETAPICVNALLEDVISAHERLAVDSSLQLQAETGDDTEIRGDRDRLLQIFENLIGNAMRFTPTGGSIAVGAAKHEREVQFWVKDSGEGISAEELPHVFERFWKGRKAKRGDGAGLGLLIVKALVEAHGGRVWVESTVGRGSSFYFTIPTVQQPAGAQRPPTRRRTIPGSMMRGRG